MTVEGVLAQAGSHRDTGEVVLEEQCVCVCVRIICVCSRVVRRGGSIVIEL